MCKWLNNSHHGNCNIFFCWLEETCSLFVEVPARVLNRPSFTPCIPKQLLLVAALLVWQATSPSLSRKTANATISYNILFALQRCFPLAASDTPCRPLLCQPFLVIHEIYTREVRTRSFALITAFFHHPFSDISETRGPRLRVQLVSCATRLLVGGATMLHFMFTALQST